MVGADSLGMKMEEARGYYSVKQLGTPMSVCELQKNGLLSTQTYWS